MAQRSGVLAAMLLLALVCAGCSAPPSAQDSETPQHPTGRSDIEMRAERPAWRLGQGWRYVVDVPGIETRTITMMVAEEREDLWVVATDDEAQALHHVLYATSPILGRTAKDTLSPYQAGTPVRMYDFPLTDGKRWSAVFFDEPMEFTAAYTGDIAVQPQLGMGEFAEGFRLEARGASGTTVHYDYVDAATWFTSFEVASPDGTRIIRLDLIEIIPRYRGPYVFLRGEELLTETFTATTAMPVLAEIEVPAATRFFDGLAVGVTYLGTPGFLPPGLNVTLLGPPQGPIADTRYFEHESRGLGHAFARAKAPVERSCIDPDDSACSGTFRLQVRLLGEARAELRLVSFTVFAEGVLP